MYRYYYKVMENLGKIILIIKKVWKNYKKYE